MDAMLLPADLTLPAPSSVPADMTIGEARAVLATHSLRSLPVVVGGRMIGLITVEALAGGDGPVPDAARPLVEVMDWHLVQVDPAAEAIRTLRAFDQAAWQWMRSRSCAT